MASILLLTLLCVSPYSPDYGEQREKYLGFQAHGGGIHSQLARLALGLKPESEPIERAVEKVNKREDCADFRIHPLLRIMYQFGGSPLLDPELKRRIKRCILGFKYWPDEPGIDGMCTWTENHYILFASAGYLAGQLYPDEIFTNSGRKGEEMMKLFGPRVIRWLDLRFKTGFSEWLSNVYYALDILALTSLIDFCRDEKIARKAEMVLDLLLLDIALNQFEGTFGATHGRSYKSQKTNGERELTASTCNLFFGLNRSRPDDSAATSLALSRYRMPSVIYEIANDRREMVNRQRMSIRIEEAEKRGLDTKRLEDGMLFLTYGAYAHPRTIQLMGDMMEEYRWWQNDFFKPLGRMKIFLKTLHMLKLLPLFSTLLEWDLTRNLRSEVNIYTYRTADYMLSSAQDYRRGYGGDQHHIWQATLGRRAICFTTHPGNLSDDYSPGYWVGSGTLPRVGQYKNVAIIIYKINTSPALMFPNRLSFTHAWLPKREFDEVIEKKGWIFARKDKGYLALWSKQPYRWCEEGECEVIAEGKENIWICELGRETEYGSFESFIDRISKAKVEVGGLSVRYESPSQGTFVFGWDGPLKRNGKRIELGGYPRYDNPYGTVPYLANEVRMECNLGSVGRSSKDFGELEDLASLARQGHDALKQALEHLRASDPGYRDLMARKVVDIAADVYISYLLLDQATLWDRKESVAGKFISDALPRIRMNLEHVLSDDRRILEEFDRIVDASAAWL